MNDPLGFDPTPVAIIITLLAPISLWILALLDIFKSRFSGGAKKKWLLIVLLIPFLGFIFYFASAKRDKLRPQP